MKANMGCCLRALSVGVMLMALSGCGQPMPEYVSEEGKFRVRMPETPSLVKDPELPRGVKKVWLLQRSGSYSVAWEDLPESEASPDKRLDGACENVKKALKTDKMSVENVTLVGKYPGRELEAEAPEEKGLVRARLYLVGRRLYTVVVTGSRWWVEKDTTREVFDSFEIIEP